MHTPYSWPCSVAVTRGRDPIVKSTVERDVFADAVAWAARSLPVRPSAPVLAGLLIEAGADGLVLSTFDYETSAQITVKAADKCHKIERRSRPPDRRHGNGTQRGRIGRH